VSGGDSLKDIEEIDKVFSTMQFCDSTLDMHAKRKALPTSDTSIKRSNSIVQNGINKVKNYLRSKLQ